MDEGLLKAFGWALEAIAEAQIRRIGMEAFNSARERQDYAPGYDEGSFCEIADEMEARVKAALGPRPAGE